jgi:hypothetical protein
VSDAFVLKIIDGKVQMDFHDFVRFAAKLEDFGIDANVEPTAPGVAIVTLKQKLQ